MRLLASTHSTHIIDGQHQRRPHQPAAPACSCTSPPPSTYHTLSLEPTTLYLNDYPSEKSPMHLQQGEHLTLTNFQRLYLYTSDSYISFPVNRHVRLHKLLGQPSNLEDDPKTIGFSQIYSHCTKNVGNEAISVSQDTGVTGD